MSGTTFVLQISSSLMAEVEYSGISQTRLHKLTLAILPARTAMLN